MKKKKKSRKKYTPEQLEVINELKKSKYKKKDVVTHLKIHNNIDISVNTITKIWNNKY